VILNQNPIFEMDSNTHFINSSGAAQLWEVFLDFEYAIYYFVHQMMEIYVGIF
jgi:hypothetical protein